MAYASIIPSSTYGQPYYGSYAGLTGYNQVVTGNTTFTLSPGYARASSNDWAIVFPQGQPNEPGLLSVDISTVGLGGCYPVGIPSLALTQNTVFPVYIISNSSGGENQPTAVVVGTTGHFLPPNYDTFRRIGYVFVSFSTGFILPFTQAGNLNERTYIFQDPVNILSAGTATTKTLLDLTVVNGLVPPNQNVNVLLDVVISPFAAGGYVAVEPGSLTSIMLPPALVYGSVAGVPSSSVVLMTATPNPTTGNANLAYFVDNAGSAATINLIGFVDSVGNF